MNIYNNLIQANLANDDGGGLRFLMAGNFPMNVYNNMIVNNVSTHEGGGIAINDAPNVRIYNNTIMKNLTTATAVDQRRAARAGRVVHVANSDQLQATLPGGSPLFSNPLLFNNIFWDNRAGTRTGATVIGLGIPGDATPIDRWDIGIADGTGNSLADELDAADERRLYGIAVKHRRRRSRCRVAVRRIGGVQRAARESRVHRRDPRRGRAAAESDGRLSRHAGIECDQRRKREQ